MVERIIERVGESYCDSIMNVFYRHLKHAQGYTNDLTEYSWEQDSNGNLASPIQFYVPESNKIYENL